MTPTEAIVVSRDVAQHSYKAGARVVPALVPTSLEDPVRTPQPDRL
ncbi:MAG: hypothetical protein H7270_13355 [Dermatophilaceae bacterium]|nr:hypothetical protein [Dermatophilaceae bacterium]